MPVTGEIIGVDVGDGMLIVITDVAVALCKKLGAVAIVFTVVLVLTAKEPVYCAEEVVG